MTDLQLCYIEIERQLFKVTRIPYDQSDWKVKGLCQEDSEIQYNQIGHLFEEGEQTHDFPIYSKVMSLELL